MLRIAVVLAVTVGTVYADQRDDARQEFAAGEAADKEHDWQNAIEHYLRAYDLAPHPFALYNIASDYEQLGQLREAARVYTRYLEVAKDSADRDRVTKHIDDLRNRPSPISVHSTPAAARVMIDGKQVGVTPYVGVVRRGEHHVTVDNGTDRQQRTATMEYGEPSNLEVALQAGTGVLVVSGSPAGATVEVDGGYVGAIPAAVTLPSGPHHLRVWYTGYATRDLEAIVVPATQTPMVVQLQATNAATGVPIDPALRPQYYLSAGGSMDAGDGSLGAALELGVRNQRFELFTQLGKYGDAYAIGLSFRIAWFASRFSPYIGFGYDYGRLGDGNSSAIGGEVEAGLRLDVVRSNAATISLRAGITLIGFVDAQSGNSSAIYPIMGTLEIGFGGGIAR
ncbi:MAG TPA: PEGA domain-containing protein [Kofleriaceae bacterium]|jgi:tetratricopeptide (TPR) repeat protein|nr:PEGA domain-containing protein [Kofleriaceae bacterium]